MALKESNKNRKKEIEEPTVPDTQGELMNTITELTDMNKTISFRSMAFSTVGVIIGIAILLLII